MYVQASRPKIVAVVSRQLLNSRSPERKLWWLRLELKGSKDEKASYNSATVNGTACAAPMKWTPGPHAKTDIEQAQAECDFEAEKAAPMMDLNANVFAQASAQGDIKAKCMKAKGFRLEPVNKIDSK